MFSWFKKKPARPAAPPDWATLMPKLVRYAPGRHREGPGSPAWQPFIADLAVEYTLVCGDDELIVSQALLAERGIDQADLHRQALASLEEEGQQVRMKNELGYFTFDADAFPWGPELMLLPPGAVVEAMTFLQGDPLIALPCRFMLLMTGTAQQIDGGRDGFRVTGDASACKGLMAQKGSVTFESVPAHYKLSDRIFSVVNGQWVAGERLVDVPLVPLHMGSDDDAGGLDAAQRP